MSDVTFQSARAWMALGMVMLLVLGAGCERQGSAPLGDSRPSSVERPVETGEDAEFTRLRERMVARQIVSRGISDAKVLVAMRKVPRHRFVPKNLARQAYLRDGALPIDEGQTISQPYIVAIMTELLALKGGEKVLEIGTGSGYQAAVLAEIAGEVYSIEIVPSLAESADRRLKALGYKVHVRAGDGYRGWPGEEPFDAIIVTAAPPYVPEPLKEQLKVGGRMVIPVGEEYQNLTVLTKTASGFTEKEIIPVLFVPMTGEVQERKGRGTGE